MKSSLQYLWWETFGWIENFMFMSDRVNKEMWNSIAGCVSMNLPICMLRTAHCMPSAPMCTGWATEFCLIIGALHLFRLYFICNCGWTEVISHFNHENRVKISFITIGFAKLIEIQRNDCNSTSVQNKLCKLWQLEESNDKTFQPIPTNRNWFYSTSPGS